MVSRRRIYLLPAENLAFVSFFLIYDTGTGYVRVIPGNGIHKILVEAVCDGVVHIHKMDVLTCRFLYADIPRRRKALVFLENNRFDRIFLRYLSGPVNNSVHNDYYFQIFVTLSQQPIQASFDVSFRLVARNND